MENTEKMLVATRNFLYKWFIIGFFACFFISGILYILAKDWAG